MGETLPDEFDFGKGLYRGDDYVWTHFLNDEPPDWEPATAYTVGDTTHDPGEVYVAFTTCTYRGVRYTCSTAHTSGATFDATMWTKDAEALGPETDISEYVFLGQYRTSLETDATLLATDEFELVTDGTDGAYRRLLTHDQSALLIPDEDAKPKGAVYWDLQATDGDGTVKTLLRGRPIIVGDVARA